MSFNRVEKMRGFRNIQYIRQYVWAIIQLSCFSLAGMAHGFCRFARVKARPANREACVTRFISCRSPATVGVETLFRRSAHRARLLLFT